MFRINPSLRSTVMLEITMKIFHFHYLGSKIQRFDPCSFVFFAFLVIKKGFEPKQSKLL